MTMDIALTVGAAAIAALLGVALLALLTRPRLPDVTEAPMISTPPPDLSPAIAGMIDTGSYPKPALTAAVTDLERQGHLSIAQPDKDGPFVLTRRRTDAPPHPDQATLMGTLFLHENTVTIDPTITRNRELLASARQAHEATVTREFRSGYYRPYGMPLVLLFLLAAAAATYVLWSMQAANLWIGGGLFLAAVLGASEAFGGSGVPPRKRAPVTAILLLGVLVVAPVATVAQLMAPAEPYLLVTAIGAAYGLAKAWLPRLTHEGVKAREAVQGMRSYMEVGKPLPDDVSAGREAADSRYRTLRPYATAMGLGPAWNARHVALLGALGVAAWAATQPHGATDSSDSSWSSDSSSPSFGATPPPDQLPDDLGSTFDSAFDSAFSEAFDSAVSDSVDSGSSGSSDSGDGGGWSDSGSSDSGGGDSGGSSSE